jgi:hypothetical protein
LTGGRKLRLVGRLLVLVERCCRAVEVGVRLERFERTDDRGEGAVVAFQAL